MERRRFVQLVRRAVADLPSPYRDWISNVDIVVERRPRRRHRLAARLGPGDTLLGLYEGLPLAARSGDTGFMLPDKITVFQESLERSCRTERELIEEIRTTVLHELAHHFGTSDEELQRLGLD